MLQNNECHIKLIFYENNKTQIVLKRREKMTYQEWSKEYDETADLIQSKIARLLKEQKTASTVMLKEINNRIAILRNMLYDCKRISGILLLREGEIY